MATPTLTLQLVFDTTNIDTAAFGRFLPDPGPAAPQNSRSKVWIADPNDGTPPRIFPDAPAVFVKKLASDPNTPEVRVRVFGIVPNGIEWDPSSEYALRIAAAFGRSGGAAPDQRLASPFRLSTAHKVVGTLFIESFTAAQAKAGPTICLGQAIFPETLGGFAHLYQFNVAAVANLRTVNGHQVSSFAFGHDPDMNVGE